MPWEVASPPFGGTNASIPGIGTSSDARLPWQTALAKSATAPAIIWFPGASTAQGGSATSNVITKSSNGQYRQAKINAGYQLGGDFFISTYTSNWSGNNAPNGWPFVNNIAPAAWVPNGPWWTPQYTATGVTLATPQMSYVHPSTDLGYSGRSFRVYYFDPGNQDGGGSGTGATWKYNVDSQSEIGATTITLLGDNQIHTFDVTGLSNSAAHTIYFGNQSGAGAMIIIGVLSCPGVAISTNGVFYCRVGSPGFTMADLASTTSSKFPADKISRYIGPNGAVAPFAPNAALSPIFQPDLVIQEPFDDVALLPPGTTTVTAVNPTVPIHGWQADAYLWGLERSSYSYRRKPSGCTVVHELPNFPDNYVSDTSVVAAFVTQNWQDTYDAHRKIAARYGHLVSETQQNWGELGVTYGFLTASNPHPTDAGAGTTPATGSPPAYLNVLPRVSRWLAMGL